MQRPCPDERTTADPVPREQLQADVALLLDTIAAGEVAIAPLDVAYAVNACTEPGIRRIYAAKKRSYEKPGGLFANTTMSRAIPRHGRLEARPGRDHRARGGHPLLHRRAVSRRTRVLRPRRSLRDAVLDQGRNHGHAAQRGPVPQRDRAPVLGARHAGVRLFGQHLAAGLQVPLRGHRGAGARGGQRAFRLWAVEIRQSERALQHHHRLPRLQRDPGWASCSTGSRPPSSGTATSS